jgi:hypothetical protein
MRKKTEKIVPAKAAANVDDQIMKHTVVSITDAATRDITISYRDVVVSKGYWEWMIPRLTGIFIYGGSSKKCPASFDQLLQLHVFSDGNKPWSPTEGWWAKVGGASSLRELVNPEFTRPLEEISKRLWLSKPTFGGEWVEHWLIDPTQLVNIEKTIIVRTEITKVFME